MGCLDKFVKLDKSTQEILQFVWDSTANPDESLDENFDFGICRKDLLKLRDFEWINDEIINFYLQLIVKRSYSNKSLPKVLQKFKSFIKNGFLKKNSFELFF